MITEESKIQKSQDKKTASKVKSTGKSGSQVKKQKEARASKVETPKTNSDALNRRAKELTKEVLQEPDVDNEKVNRIKAAIEDGTYEVDADAVAERLIADADLDGIDFQNDN